MWRRVAVVAVPSVMRVRERERERERAWDGDWYWYWDWYWSWSRSRGSGAISAILYLNERMVADFDVTTAVLVDMSWDEYGWL